MFVNIMACLCLVVAKITAYEEAPTIEIQETGILPVEKGTIGLQFYVDIENLHQWSACRVSSWPKMCCISDEPYEDCYRDGIFGDNIESVMPKRRDTLVYVFPTMYQYDLVGYCNFILDYTCGKQTRSTELLIKIPFNTTVVKKKSPDYMQSYSNLKKRSCKTLDEDSLNNCAPVKCDLKYNGRRSFFDTTRSKCINAPNCNTDLKKELPDIVYEPESNTCRDLDVPVALNEIYAISSGLGVVVEPRKSITVKDTDEIINNCTTISQNLILLKDLMTGKLCPLFKSDASAYNQCTKSAVFSICACIVATSGLLISICCCIHTLLWLFRKFPKASMRDYCEYVRAKIHRQDYDLMCVSERSSHLCRDVTNNLLKEVIVRDLPIELRESVVDICDRIGRELHHKRRYRIAHLGSQVDLMSGDSDTSTGSLNKTHRHSK